MENKYAKLSSINLFNKNFLNPTPEEMCLLSDVQKSLTGGVLAAAYGPKNEKCQLFMSDRCAKNWDVLCETASKNKAVSPNLAFVKNNLGGETVGNQLVHNSAERRFCTFDNCTIEKLPLMPLHAQTPEVDRIVDRGYKSCMPTCRVDPRSIDKDQLMRKCLENPGLCDDVLDNICRTHNASGVSLHGTKIGEYCKQKGFAVAFKSAAKRMSATKSSDSHIFDNRIIFTR